MKQHMQKQLELEQKHMGVVPESERACYTAAVAQQHQKKMQQKQEEEEEKENWCKCSIL